MKQNILIGCITIAVPHWGARIGAISKGGKVLADHPFLSSSSFSHTQCNCLPTVYIFGKLWSCQGAPLKKREGEYNNARFKLFSGPSGQGAQREHKHNVQHLASILDPVIQGTLVFTISVKSYLDAAFIGYPYIRGLQCHVFYSGLVPNDDLHHLIYCHQFLLKPMLKARCI
jgi:hypothetical protein